MVAISKEKIIQQFRGLESNLPTLLEGQIGFTTDTKKLFIGSIDGNIKITNKEEIEAINDIILKISQDESEISTQLNTLASDISNLLASISNVDEKIVSGLADSESKLLIESEKRQELDSKLLIESEKRQELDSKLLIESEKRQELENIIKTSNSEKIETLTKGVSTVNSKLKSPVNIRRIDGETIVNHIPLFDSGIWKAELGRLDIVTPNEVNLVSSGIAYAYVSLKASLNPNTVYTFSADHNGHIAFKMGDVFLVADTTDTVATFTTPSIINGLEMYISSNSNAGTFNFKNLSLVEGSKPKPFVANAKGLTNPTIANETNNTSLVIPTTLHDGEYVERDSYGNLIKYKKWQEKTLDSNDVEISFDVSRSGYKTVKILVQNYKNNVSSAVKFDGSILSKLTTDWTKGDEVSQLNSSHLFISILDKDSGWGEQYTPTKEEVKAYFLGWRMHKNGGNRDAKYDGTGVKQWFAISNYYASGDIFNFVTTTLPTNRADINNFWQPYKIIHELNTPIEEAVTPYGDLTLEKGINDINVYSGRIVNEHVKPHVSGDGWVSINNTAVSISNLTKYKSLDILNVSTNSIPNIDWHKIYDNSNGSYRIGKWLQNIDITASCAVDYEPLYTWEITTPIENVKLQYFESLQDTVGELVSDVALNQDIIKRMSEDVVFKDEGIEWIKPTLLNGFSFAGGYKNSYFKDSSNNVHLNLLLEGVGAPNVVITNLPKGFRPSQSIASVSKHYSPLNNLGFVTVFNSGDVLFSNSDSVGNSYHVVNITFRAEL